MMDSGDVKFQSSCNCNLKYIRFRCSELRLRQVHCVDSRMKDIDYTEAL